MKQVIAIVLLSIPILLISLKSLKTSGSHGFYRFFSWEAILVLLVFKIKYWFVTPFAPHQIFSWLLLFVSLGLVFAGLAKIKRTGHAAGHRKDEKLYPFERTSKIIDSGIFKYIRHPMYSSLLFLTWGIYLKSPDWILLHVALLASVLLYLTARTDEKECIVFFGDDYKNYMKKTKRFIPFLF